MKRPTTPAGWTALLAALSCDPMEADKALREETGETAVEGDSDEVDEDCSEPARLDHFVTDEDMRALVLVSSESGAGFGQSVSLLGDLSGDGMGDLAVGAPDADASNGQVFLWLGPMVPDRLASDDADGRLLGTDGDQLGQALAGGGDIDADGAMDLAIGAPGGSRVVLLLSSTYSSEDRDLVADTVLETDSAGSGLGTYVDLLPDLDGDGIGDVVAGDAQDGAGGEGAGAVFVALGPISAGTWLVEDADLKLLGDPGDSVGLARHGGDFNGDGYNDLAVGAPLADDEVGKAWVIYGGAVAGVSPLEDANGSLLEVPTFGDSIHFGQTLTSAGDLEGDDADEIAVGSTIVEEEMWSLVSIFEGHGSTLYRWIEGVHEAGVDTVMSPGDFDGDGSGDMVWGMPRADVYETENSGFVSILFVESEPVAGSSQGMDLEHSHFYWSSPDAATGTSVDGESDLSGDAISDIAIGVPGAYYGAAVVLSGCW